MSEIKFYGNVGMGESNDLYANRTVLNDPMLNDQQLERMKDYDSINIQKKSIALAELSGETGCCWFWKKKRKMRETWAKRVKNR